MVGGCDDFSSSGGGGGVWRNQEDFIAETPPQNQYTPPSLQQQEGGGRIVGGTPIDISDYPWLVLLRDKYSLFQRCAGSLIAPQWVISATHCFGRSETIDDYVVSFLVKDINAKEPAIEDIPVAGLWGFPEHKGDIVLLKLQYPATSVTTFMKLPIDESDPLDITKNVNSTVLVAGYGDLASSENNLPGNPNIVEVYIMKCTSGDIAGLGIDEQFEFCAGVQEGGKDSCQGDSGGPLFAYDPSSVHHEAVLLGVVSRGIGCALMDHPGVYTTVAFFSSWIRSHLAADSEPTEGWGCDQSWFNDSAHCDCGCGATPDPDCENGLPVLEQEIGYCQEFCNDGLMNGDELDVDCGPSCEDCPLYAAPNGNSERECTRFDPCTLEVAVNLHAVGIYLFPGHYHLSETLGIYGSTTPWIQALYPDAGPVLISGHISVVFVSRGMYFKSLVFEDYSIIIQERSIANFESCQFINTKDHSFECDDSECKFQSCSFRNHSSQMGALSVSSSKVTVQDSTFENVESHSRGGAIYSLASDLTLKNVTIISASAFEEGGAIYVESKLLTGSLFQDVDIVGSRSAGKGGGISVFSSSTPDYPLVTMNGLVLVNTSSVLNGGGIYLRNAAVNSIQSVTFNNCYSEEGNGGALSMEGHDALWTGGSVVASGCWASLSGGTVSVNDQSTFNPFELEISSSWAKSGGALSIENSSFSVALSKIRSSKAISNGGAILARAAYLDLGNSKLIQNESGLKGGGMLADASTVVARELRLMDNLAGTDGGGLCCLFSSLDGEIALKDNKARHKGGNVYLENSTLTLNGFYLTSRGSASCGLDIACLHSTLDVSSVEMVFDPQEKQQQQQAMHCHQCAVVVGAQTRPAVVDFFKCSESCGKTPDKLICVEECKQVLCGRDSKRVNNINFIFSGMISKPAS